MKSEISLNDIFTLIVQAETRKELDALNFLDALCQKDVESLASAIGIRLHRPMGDEVIDWCLEFVTHKYPGLKLNTQGDTVLIKIAQSWTEEKINHHREKVLELLKKPESLFLTNDDGQTALLVAASEDKIGLTEDLIKAGAKVDHLDIYNRSMVDLIAKSKRKESFFNQMMSLGLLKNEILSSGWHDVFYQAISDKHHDLVNRMYIHMTHTTNLMDRAVSEGNMTVVKHLIDLGMNLASNPPPQDVSWVERARKLKQGQMMGIFELALRQASL